MHTTSYRLVGRTPLRWGGTSEDGMNTLAESAVTALRLITSLDPVLLDIVRLSLAVSACACLLACGGGLVLGAWLGVARFPGRGSC